MHLSFYPLLKQKRSAFFNALLILAMFLGFCSNSYSASVKVNDAKPPMKVKVVVVSMFEIGNDEGDAPGELQLWKARQKLTTQYPLPHGFHDIYANPDTGVIGMVTGMGIARASAAIMALGLDPRFDLSQAYWLVAGIAGVDPADNTIGTAIWPDYVVGGHLAHPIDAK